VAKSCGPGWRWPSQEWFSCREEGEAKESESEMEDTEKTFFISIKIKDKKHQKLKQLPKYVISKLIKMNEEIKCQKWKTMNANFVSNFAQVLEKYKVQEKALFASFINIFERKQLT
jgi:hypothetical protein